MEFVRPIFVTSNEHKRREVANILGVELRSAAPDVDEIQSLDVAAVAAAKARAARQALGDPPEPVLVEDSGLAVGAWDGFPGALTKWLLGAVGNEGLLRMLAPGEDRSARAVCAVAVVDGSGGGPYVFVGEVVGSLASEPRGRGGFGFDPVFVPEGSSLTYAQMGEAKSQDSHRARAFRAVRLWMEGSQAPEERPEAGWRGRWETL